MAVRDGFPCKGVVSGTFTDAELAAAVVLTAVLSFVLVSVVCVFMKSTFG